MQVRVLGRGATSSSGVVFKEILAGPSASLFSIDRRRSIVQMPHSGTTGAKSSSAVYLPKQTRTSLFLNIGMFEETKTKADVINWKISLFV